VTSTIAALSVAAERFGGRPAVEDEELTLSYSELLERSRNFGAALVSSGVGQGDRVAIWAPNCAEWVVALLGLSGVGAVLVPINTRFKGFEAAEILARSRTCVLVTVTGFLDTDFVGMLSSTGIDLPDLRRIVVAKGAAPEGAVPLDMFLAEASEADRVEADRGCDEVRESDPSDILFTSGTTGVPKGVVSTHGRTVRVAKDWVRMTGLGPDDRYLMVNPYFHMFGLKAGILACMDSGATMLPQNVFEVDRVLQRVHEERVTVLPGPPTLYREMLDHPAKEDFDLSSLRVAVTGSADIPIELIRRIRHELPFSVIVTGYGLTEAGTATSTSPGDDPETIATTVGRPRPGFEVRLVDGEARDVPVGRIGEILLRGGSVMSHYLDDPDATASVLSSDGWLRTGDLGVLDPAGNLRIVGRTKDMFIVGGFNVYPAEIENVLIAHPAVQQVAVIGVPDERLGEVGMAFVVPVPGNSASAADITSWCRERIANYKVPRHVEFVEELPLNATGKVHKEELRIRAAAR
jgi:HIP---CoA ligase